MQDIPWPVYAFIGMMIITCFVVFQLGKKRESEPNDQESNLPATRQEMDNEAEKISLLNATFNSKQKMENTGCNKQLGSTIQKGDTELDLIECINYNNVFPLDMVELLKLLRLRHPPESSESSMLTELLNSERFKSSRQKRNIRK